MLYIMHLRNSSAIFPLPPPLPFYNRLLAQPAQPGHALLDQIDIVLVRPRNPLNIGAAARAMANFGLSHLIVVHPYEPHWRDARSAVQSTQILDNAIVTDTVAEAVASTTLVLGTASLIFRNPEQPVLHLPDVCLTVAPELARGGRLALLFGPENHGLNLEDLALCHQLLLIPTAEAQPSMNLGQAVAVCLYELATRLIPPDTITTEAAAPGASHLGTWDGIVLRAGAPGPSHLGTGETDGLSSALNATHHHDPRPFCFFGFDATAFSAGAAFARRCRAAS